MCDAMRMTMLVLLVACRRRVRLQYNDAVNLAAASRVRCRRPGDPTILYTTDEPAELAALASALETRPATGAYCMCIGTVVFELDGVDPAAITLHHGTSLRWDASHGNHELVDPDAIMDWLSARGMGFVRDDHEASRRAADDTELQAARWRAAMPRSLQPFFDDMRRTGGRSRPEWTAAIEAELPDPVERAGVLLDLYGSGVGPWSGYPSWESVPEELLLAMPLPVLVDALARAFTPRRCDGAIRLFCSWSFRPRRKELRKKLPEDVRVHLLAHARALPDEEKRRDVERVLAQAR